MTTDIKNLLALSAELEELRSECEDQVGQAKDLACDARGSAQDAEVYANNAQSEADTCDDRCIDARDLLGEIARKMAELEAAIRLLDPETTPDASGSSLEADIRANKKRVIRALKQGHSVNEIARAFKLSETLVEMIRRRHFDKATA